MPLIEIRKRALGAQIQPVLSDQIAALISSAQRAVVDRFGIDVLQARRESALQAAAQLKLTGVADGVPVGSQVDKPGGTSWARIRRARGKCVGEKLLLFVGSLAAKIRTSYHQRPRQIALHRHLPG